MLLIIISWCFAHIKASPSIVAKGMALHQPWLRSYPSSNYVVVVVVGCGLSSGCTVGGLCACDWHPQLRSGRNRRSMTALPLSDRFYRGKPIWQEMSGEVLARPPAVFVSLTHLVIIFLAVVGLSQPQHETPTCSHGLAQLTTSLSSAHFTSRY